MDLKAQVNGIDLECWWIPDWHMANRSGECGECKTETMKCCNEIRVMVGFAMVLGFDMGRSAEPRADEP
jgi:hypothetical protein